MQTLNAPTKFNVPSDVDDGPNSNSSNLYRTPRSMRVPRGNESCQVAIPQCIPFAGASSVFAKGLPIITASAPQATLLQTSPPVLIPPSVTIDTYLPVSS